MDLVRLVLVTFTTVGAFIITFGKENKDVNSDT